MKLMVVLVVVSGRYEWGRVAMSAVFVLVLIFKVGFVDDVK
jgi:hypothetical protein